MRAKNISLLIVAMLVLLTTACYKDKGNYDYIQPNTINISGIDAKYTVMQGNYLEIVPKLTFSEAKADDSARYTYEWIGMKTGTSSTTKEKDLGYNKSLRMNMTLEAGSYNVYYRIKDKETGLQFQKSFMITVTTAIYEGWMVMAEVNGAPRLDMVSKLDGKFNVIPDVLSYVGSSLKLQGKPRDVTCFRVNATATGYGIYLLTDKTTDRIDAETFQYTSTLNIKYEMLSNIPETFAPSLIFSSGTYRAHMIEGTDAYYFYNVMNIRFGLPINILKDEANTFKIAPFIAANSSSSQTAFYDITNKRFVRHINDESTMAVMPAGTLFDYNTGMDLVYMTHSLFNNGNVFAILHDVTANKYQLARFTIGSNIQQVYYEHMTATDIDKATGFAVSPDLGYIFYTVGGKLYSYDMSAKASKLMIDKGAEMFSAIKFNSNTLMVGSYDPAKPEGTNGTLESYTVQPVQGPLVLQSAFTGLGRIKGFSYRVR